MLLVQIICKLNQTTVNFEEEIDLVSEHIFKFVFNDNCLLLFYIIGLFFFLIRKPTFVPQLEFINKLTDLCKLLLKFCKTKEQFGASQQDIKVNNNKIMHTITCYLLSEFNVSLFFRNILSTIYLTIYLWT